MFFHSFSRPLGPISIGSDLKLIQMALTAWNLRIIRATQDHAESLALCVDLIINADGGTWTLIQLFDYKTNALPIKLHRHIRPAAGGRRIIPLVRGPD